MITAHHRMTVRALHLPVTAAAVAVEGDTCQFHKTFRQCDVFPDPDQDMFVWNELRDNNVFWESIGQVNAQLGWDSLAEWGTPL